MTTATLILVLAAPPVQDCKDGIEVLEAFAQVPGNEPVDVVVRAILGKNGSDAANMLKGKAAGDLIITEGELRLQKDSPPALYVRTVSEGHKDQYINNVLLVGRLAEKCRSTEKSAARSVGVNRYYRKQGEEKPVEETDWFRIRGFGYQKDKLEKADKGALIEAVGVLSQRTSRTGEGYAEIKLRSLRTHQGSKAGFGADPASGKAAGYDHDAFTGNNDDEPMPSDWSSN